MSILWIPQFVLNFFKKAPPAPADSRYQIGEEVEVDGLGPMKVEDVTDRYTLFRSDDLCYVASNRATL